MSNKNMEIDLTEKTKYFAIGVIWDLSKSLKRFSGKSESSTLDPNILVELSKSLEWLSALVFDDWGYDFFNSNYQDVKNLCVTPFLEDDCRWKDLCEEISIRAGEPPYFGKQDLRFDLSCTYEGYLKLGLERGFVRSQKKGMLSSKEHYVLAAIQC